jgi:hypothetical protein
METPEDEKFEMFLKRFEPIAPEPIPRLRFSYASRRSFRVGALLAAVAAMLLTGSLLLYVHYVRVVVPNTVTTPERRWPMEPLTMRSANTWLSTAPSFKAAIDDLAFRAQSEPIPKGKQSAVAVLSREKIKL